MLKALKQKKKAAVDKMNALLKAAADDNRDLTADEITEFDGLKDDIANINAGIERAEYAEGQTAEVNTVVHAASRAGAPAPVRAGGPEAKKEFESLGEFMHAVRFKPNDQRLEWKQDIHGEHNTQDGASGGFAVPKTFIGELKQAEGQGAIIRPRATVLPAGSPPDAEVSMPALNQTDTNMRGGVAVSWIGEGSSKPDTSMKIREISLKPQEVAATTIITDKLLRNWQSAGSVLSSMLNKAVVAAEELAFLKGDGAAKPLGILNSGGLTGVNRATLNRIKIIDIANMLAVFKGDNPVFMYNPSCLPQLITLADDGGRFIWVGGDAAKGIPDTILGYPAYRNENCNALNAKGDIVLCDLAQYLIKDGSGPYVAASEHVLFQSNKTMFKITWNVDGQSWTDGGLKGEDGTLRYPFVTLNLGT